MNRRIKHLKASRGFLLTIFLITRYQQNRKFKFKIIATFDDYYKKLFWLKWNRSSAFCSFCSKFKVSSAGAGSLSPRSDIPPSSLLPRSPLLNRIRTQRLTTGRRRPACSGWSGSDPRENWGGVPRSSWGETSKSSSGFHQGWSSLFFHQSWSQEYKEMVKAEEERRKAEEERIKASNTTAPPKKVKLSSLLWIRSDVLETVKWELRSSSWSSWDPLQQRALAEGKTNSSWFSFRNLKIVCKSD